MRTFNVLSLASAVTDALTTDECGQGWFKTNYPYPRCLKNPSFPMWVSKDEATATCAKLGATLKNWNPYSGDQSDALCEKKLLVLDNCKSLIEDRADPWMKFSESNNGRNGYIFITKYNEDIHCNYDIITTCDPDTESIEVRIYEMQIRGGDHQCSEDFITFSTSGGFDGLGDYGNGQVKVQHYVKDIETFEIK